MFIYYKPLPKLGMKEEEEVFFVSFNARNVMYTFYTSFEICDKQTVIITAALSLIQYLMSRFFK